MNTAHKNFLFYRIQQPTEQPASQTSECEHTGVIGLLPGIQKKSIQQNRAHKYNQNEAVLKLTPYWRQYISNSSHN